MKSPVCTISTMHIFKLSKLVESPEFWSANVQRNYLLTKNEYVISLTTCIFFNKSPKIILLVQDTKIH
jgi:hypothetical protein